MLAQNFKTVADLKITERDHQALIQVLGMLERAELKHVVEHDEHGRIRASIPNGFNMCTQGSKHRCGTVACIGGWVAYLTNRNADRYVNHCGDSRQHPLFDLYWGNIRRDTTTEQAAQGLRNFLTLGKPCWDEVMA